MKEIFQIFTAVLFPNYVFTCTHKHKKNMSRQLPSIKVLCYLQNNKIWVVVLFGKKLSLALTCRQSKYSLYIYNMHIFQFWVLFWPFLFCYFQKLQLLVVKIFWNNPCCIVFLFAWAQKVCLRFLKSYFKLEMILSLSFVVPFLVDMFN